MSNALLDIDDSLLKKNLLLTDNKEENELSELLKSFEKPQVASTLVRPLPGACAKMRTESGDKGFINICHTSEIPPPENISEEELVGIATSDEPSFVIPMSIGQERLEPDKGGALCHTYDIAVNTEFFNKCQSNKIFMPFTLEVMIEAVNNKFNKTFQTDSCLMLKNRKVMGTLQQHRIEKRKVRKPQFPKPLIQEVEDNPKRWKKTEPIPIPKTLNVTDDKKSHQKLEIKKSSDYIILKELVNGKAEHLVGLFKVPTLILENVSVHVGEDRIIVETSESNYFVDIFVPCSLDQEKISAEMDSNLGIMRLNMPLKC